MLKTTKNKIYLGIILVIIILIIGIISLNNIYHFKNEEKKKIENKETEINKGNKKMKVIINNKEYNTTLENNETTTSLLNLLPLELDMTELNGNEKYYYLDKSLPTDSFVPEKIEKGDIMLYGNNCLVVFYKTFKTSYRYTKIGHIDNLPDLDSSNIKIIFND